jgi:hypothetical protein
VIFNRLLDLYDGDSDGVDNSDGPTIELSPWAVPLARLGAIVYRWPELRTLASATPLTTPCNVLSHRQTLSLPCWITLSIMLQPYLQEH